MFKYRIPKLTIKRGIAIAVLLLAVFTLTACPEVETDRERVVIIFSDVTSSLLPSESNGVATLTCDILDSLPPGTRYFVYPIQIEPQKLEPIDEGTIVAEPIRTTADAVKAARRDKISHETKKLYDLIKSVKRPADGYGSPDNHTCILYTLQFAQDKFRQFDQNNTDFDLIYISDMIEECNTTPMGRPISLGKRNISEAITLAQQTNLNLDLSYARVSMIVPATNDTYLVPGRPNVSDLRDFWKAILLHCGFTEELLKNNQKFYFSSGIPRHLQAE